MMLCKALKSTSCVVKCFFWKKMKFQWNFAQYFTNMMSMRCHSRFGKQNLSCTCHRQDFFERFFFCRKLHEFSRSGNQILRNSWRSTISCHRIKSGTFQIQLDNRKPAVQTAPALLKFQEKLSEISKIQRIFKIQLIHS